MTCREFKREAAGLSAAEVTRLAEPLAQHAATCEACGVRLEKQRRLAASMQTLRAQTAGLEAGPSVERALLRVFRQETPAGAAAVSAEVASGILSAGFGTARHSKPAPGSTPIAWRLSRWFEVGAYAAVAAAIAVAVFLGAHVLHSPAGTIAAQSQTPMATQPSATAPTPSGTEQRPSVQVASSGIAPKAPRATHITKMVAIPSANSANEDVPSNDAGYIALMLCDPLSCSSDTQVVRMELPDSQGATQMADVVVGLDGMVRAVRFVN
jgi:hypothetical protein